MNQPDDHLVLHYYGNGGWGMLWRDTYVVTVPYFSHDGPFHLENIEPHRGDIGRGLANTPIDSTALLLAGHGHHDHIADLPVIAEYVPANTVAVVNRTTANNLHSIDGLEWRVIEADESGHWLSDLPNSDIVRIMPMKSKHPPHVRLFGLWGVTLFGGTVDSPRNDVPTTVHDFKSGQTWAFLIDFLDASGETAFRLHYQDSAGEARGWPVPELADPARPVDIHIACVAGFDNVDTYPEDLLQATDSRYMLAAHWEDFFGPREKVQTVNVLPMRKLRKFIDRAESVLGTTSRGVAPVATPAGPHAPNWAIAVPGETFAFPAATATTSP